MRPRGARQLALSLLMSCAINASAAPTQTVGEFLLTQQREMLTPVVEYCEEELPSQKDRFIAAHARFKGVVEEAVAPLNSRFSAYSSKPMPTGIELPTPGLQILASAKQVGAAGACPDILQMLEGATAEPLRAIVEKEFARMEARARQRSEENKK